MMCTDEEKHRIQQTLLDPKYTVSGAGLDERLKHARELLDELNRTLAIASDAGLEEHWELLMAFTGQGWDVLVVSHGDDGTPAGHLWTVRATLDQAMKVPGAKAILPMDLASGDVGYMVNADGGATGMPVQEAEEWVDSFSRGPTGDIREEGQVWPLMEYWAGIRFKHRIRHMKQRV